jgi:hypothetical protein
MWRGPNERGAETRVRLWWDWERFALFAEKRPVETHVASVLENESEVNDLARAIVVEPRMSPGGSTHHAGLSFGPANLAQCSRSTGNAATDGMLQLEYGAGHRLRFFR